MRLQVLRGQALLLVVVGGLLAAVVAGAALERDGLPAPLAARAAGLLGRPASKLPASIEIGGRARGSPGPLPLLLPAGWGRASLRTLGARGARLPVLVLTAKDDVGSKVTGLDQGADDYLTKPFVFEELLARIRALLRRDQASAVELRAGGLVLDLQQRSARGSDGEAQ